MSSYRSTFSMQKTSTIALTAQLCTLNGNTSDAGATWATGNAGIVSISTAAAATTIITGVTAGATTITCTFTSGVTWVYTVTVIDPALVAEYYVQAVPEPSRGPQTFS